MKILNQKAMGVAIIALAALAPALVYASTAANTSITNTVTVNFEDASNNAQPAQTASVSLTVNLVASAPILSSPADIDPSTENTTETLTYTITGTANGPDTYDFSSSDSRTNMDADATFTTPSVTLGGTTVASAVSATDTVITVPYDGADDSDVNGITAGDTLVIDPSGAAEVVTVSSVDESTGAASNTVTITLTAGTTGAYGIGVIIGERDTVALDVTTDTITTGTSGTHSVSSTATSQDDGTVSTTQTTATVITVRKPGLTVSKYVRNVTNPVAGTTAETVGGTTWYAADVSGVPGDTMEYLIVVDNTAAGSGTANNIVVSDPVPQFTTFVASSITLDATGTGTFTAQDETADNGDAAELDATGNGTVYVYAGSGGDDTAAGAGNGTGGSLASGEVSRVVFRVTID